MDELFAARAPIEEPFRSPPLVRCLFEFSKKVYLELEFREKRMAFFSEVQKAEAERLGIDTAGGLGKKKDAIPFIEKFCGALGFEGRAGNRWRKKLADGLVFEVGVWLGGNVFRKWSPLKFRIFHLDEPKYGFDTEGSAVLGRLIPGADMYTRVGNDLEYILGVRALIEFYVIAGTFEGAQAS